MRRDERGVALMLVLWVIVVLGVVGAGIVSVSRAQADLAGTVRARTVARYAAESGIVAARARLEAAYRVAGTPAERAAVFSRFEREVTAAGEQVVGEARFQVAVTDLGARVDLNRADPEVTGALLQGLFGSRGGGQLHRALRERALGGPLLRLDALTRVPGFTDSILDRLAPFATVHGDGRVNVNTAPTEVLAAIPGIGADGAASIIAARESGPLASAIAIAPHLRGRRTDGGIGPVGTEPSRILVVSRGWAAGHPSTREIQVVFEVVRGFLDAPTRLRVRHWVERDR